MDRKGQYRLGWRSEHTTAVVGEVLYCWGGAREGLVGSHDSPTKRQTTSAIDAFNLLSGVWSSQPTRGTPPLGIRGVSCTTINNNIYYFGGYCGHDSCYHNSLNYLDTLTLQWKELQPTSDNSVTKRGYGGMIAMGSESEPQQLLVIGGQAPISTITHHYQFEYEKITGLDYRVRTNEQNIYNLFSGQWTVPSVSGQCCPPTSGFTVEKINHNKGIMYGGAVHDGIATNSIYLFQLSHNTINWEYLKEGAIPNDGLWSKERCAHASTIINGVSTSPILVVIGGYARGQPVNDCLLLETNLFTWMKIPLPESVTSRYDHTVSSFVVDPNHVFLIIVGGGLKTEQKHVGGGGGGGGRVIKWINTPVTDPNITMVVKLVFNDGQWSVGSVLNLFNIPLLHEQILKERREELNEYMADKQKEQVINESLRHDLQVSRINNQSLQEALLETQSLSEKRMLTLEKQLLETKTLLTKRKRDQEDSPHSDNFKKLKTDELEESVEEKQIMTGEYEKLNAIVTDNEVYITELLEEKTQVEEQLKEKQIIINDFKTTVFEKDAYISKLVKEKSQQQERITFQEEQSIKETSSVEVQFNYLIPSMDNLECLSDVQVAEKKLFLIQGDKPQLMNWEKYGLRIGVQEDSLLASETVEAAVVALVGGKFQFPPNTVLVSAVYAVSLSKPLLKPLQLEIQHCIDLSGRPDLVGYLKFAIAPVSTASLPYQFTLVEGGEFRSDSSYGCISRREFCLVCACGECNGGGGGTAESLPSGSSSSADPISVAGLSREATGTNNSSTSDQQNVRQQVESQDSDSTSVQSQLSEATKYAGLVYYEEKGVEDLVTFTGAKKLNALLEVPYSGKFWRE